MKPIKSLSPVAEWLMRSGIVLFAVLYYLEILEVKNFKSVMFYISLGFILFSFLLFVGGFLRKTSLTMISSIVLILLTGYQTVIFVKSGIDYNFAVFVIIGSVLFHFLANGNKQ
jgi:hypothetical protein